MGSTKKQHSKVKEKTSVEVFLVRHLNPKKNDQVSQVGPFHDEKEAMSACMHFLKRGTCSWLVRYNG